jgi:hypothetical protein
VKPISLTTFLDFTTASGPSKLSVIRAAKKRYDAGYSQGSDYYKRFRDQVVDMHKRGLPLSSLDDALLLTRSAHHDNYRAAIAGYRKWLGRKKVEWRDPVSSVWSAAGLEVRVNPELFLKVEGKWRCIKMYTKAPAPTKHRLDAALYLLQVNVADPHGAVGSILDMRRGRLYDATAPKRDMDLYLTVEAQSFVTMWEAL